MIIPEIIDTHRHVYGTYAIMAQMNIQSVLDHIQKVVNIDAVGCAQDRLKEYYNSPENLWKHPVIVYLGNSAYSNDNYPEKTKAVIERLLQYFPFLKAMAEIQREYDYQLRVNKEREKEESKRRKIKKRLEVNSRDIHTVLDLCLRVVKKYRDYTSHSHIKDDSWSSYDRSKGEPFLERESRVSFIINRYYDVALRNVKERYGYETAQLAFIQDYRYKRELSSEGKKMVVDLDFFLSMQSFNGESGKGRKLHLSGVGVAQLIILFLEKKYAHEFIEKLSLRGKYSKQSEEYRIIRRSMTINSIALPKDRIRSDKRVFSIAMDMINELKRCPEELFDTLSQDNQSRFRVVSSDFNEVLLKRSSDRFTQLALQYIDYNRLFEKIRFHVNMGKLRYLYNPNKLCIDGQVRVRVLEHLINGYGRLDEMEMYRKCPDGTYGDSKIMLRNFDNAIRDDANAANYPYVIDTATHYLLNNNKIEFCFSPKKIVPYVCKDDNNGKWYVEKTIPTCRMSAFELPAMMFHMMLLGAPKTEKLIEDTYNKYVKLFGAMIDGSLSKENIDSYGIAPTDMPRQVLDYVNGVTTRKKEYHNAVKRQLSDMLHDTQLRIERIKEDKRTINSGNNKMGKRSFKKISTGKLAEYLAQDIVKLQPTLRTGSSYGSDRITSMNYRILQSSLAIYHSDEGDSRVALEKLKSLFEEARLIGGGVRNRDKNHPFLYKVFNKNPRNTVEFYEYYLNEKCCYTQDLLKKIDEGDRVEPTFINQKNNKWLPRNKNYYKIIGEIYLNDLSIELPRQMFDTEIKNVLRTLPQMAHINYDEANVTYLIGEYLKQVKEDDFQDFYAWKRNFRYIDMLLCEITRLGSIAPQYTSLIDRETLWTERAKGEEKYKEWARTKAKNPATDEVISKRLAACKVKYQKIEKAIRRYKVQDALLFMMAENALKGSIELKTQEFKLKDIMPDSDKGILSKSMPLEFVFEKNGKKYSIHAQEMKLKNYGDFFALALDKRIVPLFNILSTQSVDKVELENEFDNYDISRPTVTKLVMDFEQYAYEKYPDMLTLVENQEHFDFKQLLNELIARGDMSSDDTYILSQIRNAFSHNVYPKNSVVEIRTLPEVARHLIKIFGRYAQIIKD